MLRYEAQLLSKLKEKTNIAHDNDHSQHLSFPFIEPKPYLKKYISYVKDILHRTVNRAQYVGVWKNPLVKLLVL